jgi:hypothetical protein
MVRSVWIDGSYLAITPMGDIEPVYPPKEGCDEPLAFEPFASNAHDRN